MKISNIKNMVEDGYLALTRVDNGGRSWLRGTNEYSKIVIELSIRIRI